MILKIHVWLIMSNASGGLWTIILFEKITVCYLILIKQLLVDMNELKKKIYGLTKLTLLKTLKMYYSKSSINIFLSIIWIIHKAINK
jgi:hypothetical protein